MSTTSHGWRRPRNHTGVFIDRCIDRRLAAELRKIPYITARGLEDIYGPDSVRTVPDVEFLTDAGQHGWMVWTQNPDMWKVPHEQKAIVDAGTHVFTLASAQLVTPGKAFVFGRWWLPMVGRHRRPGPCFWRLYADRTLKNLK